MSNQEFSDFEEFWPHFLSQHRHPATRWLHVAAVVVGTRGVYKAIRKRRIRPLISGVMAAGAIAAFAHRVFEGNSPQNFGRPLWGARGFARLVLRTVTGRVADDLADLPSNS